MTWTYSGDPLANDKDAVRFEIGDTDQAYPLLQDEEINAALTREGNTLGASAYCCEVLARKFARDVDNSLGPQKVTASQRYKQYNAQARELRRRAVALNIPFAGGLSKTERTANQLNTDLPQPTFTRDMMAGS